ncbi:HAD family phosphatase [Selenomonas sp. WCA-380-WT-3B 3/]|uniref:HAD family phosphatase n=1 Tax=Selenomonas montiformis TaxID=2652285 RepID=A0A6I2UZ56_9FIRM|nr:Cof-type HAD-IIB family hydrolase [Selenomonas montiformis]MSV24512.1 HAD family phosphatase [Selenomonas montiformis]
MYKMIALDLDGTLNNDEKEITPKTREALLAVQRLGVTVVLASGRQAPGLRREAEALCLKDYHGLLLSYNGGRIQDATTGEILFDSNIDNDTAVAFLRHLEEWPELSPIVDDGESIYTTDARRHKVMDESRNNNLRVKIVPNIADAVAAGGFRPVKILTAAPNEVLVPHLSDIRRGFEEDMSFVQSAPWFYEGTIKGVSKSSSLSRVCERLGVDPSEVMAFGDAQNDMSMLEFAGCGVAMGNACAELKDMADEVTLSNNEDGIAVSLARHFSW